MLLSHFVGALRIVSDSSQPFNNRREAGQLLGQELAGLKGRRAVVLGVPRGGLVVGQELALQINADLDVVLAHKLRAPNNAELAIGAVAEDGQLFLHTELVSNLGITEDYINNEKGFQLERLASQTEKIRRVLPHISLKNRLVIITDDGVATGATLQAALWAARQEQPRKLVVALPVGPEETLKRLATDADETVCLRAPTAFAAVGQFYDEFNQVEDDETLSILKQENRRRLGK